MRKNQWITALLCFVVPLLLTGCLVQGGGYSQPESEPPPSQEFGASDVVNLPEKLHIETEGVSANRVSYSFNVAEPTEMEVTLETETGEIQLAITARAEPGQGETDPVYETDYLSGSGNVVLEPGDYDVIIRVQEHVGSYDIEGKAADGDELFENEDSLGTFQI